jgi:hypothetical protein
MYAALSGGFSVFGLQTPDDPLEDAFGLVGTGLAGPDAPEEPHEQQDVSGVALALNPKTRR